MSRIIDTLADNSAQRARLKRLGLTFLMDFTSVKRAHPASQSYLVNLIFKRGNKEITVPAFAKKGSDLTELAPGYLASVTTQYPLTSYNAYIDYIGNTGFKSLDNELQYKSLKKAKKALLTLLTDDELQSLVS